MRRAVARARLRAVGCVPGRVDQLANRLEQFLKIPVTLGLADRPDRVELLGVTQPGAEAALQCVRSFFAQPGEVLSSDLGDRHVVLGVDLVASPELHDLLPVFPVPSDTYS